MPSVMSVSVHCMRLAASYDTLTEGKLRYRLAQSHTHPIRSVWVIYRTHLYYLALNRVLTCLHDSIQKITLFGRKINAENHLANFITLRQQSQSLVFPSQSNNISESDCLACLADSSLPSPAPLTEQYTNS